MFEEGQNETLGYHKELISTIVLLHTVWEVDQAKR